MDLASPSSQNYAEAIHEWIITSRKCLACCYQACWKAQLMRAHGNFTEFSSRVEIKASCVWILSLPIVNFNHTPSCQWIGFDLCETAADWNEVTTRCASRSRARRLCLIRRNCAQCLQTKKWLVAVQSLLTIAVVTRELIKKCSSSGELALHFPSY